jgi:energy-coupling factor transport system permease protein
MGQYVPLKSPVHELDPRAKLFLLVAILFTIFFSGDFLSLTLCAAAFLGIARLARLPARLLARSCRPVFFLAIFTFIFNFVTGWQGEGLSPAGHALGTALLAVTRFLLLVLFAVLLPLTTAPLELADGLEALLSPLARFGVPAHECAMMMSVALRFIPLLMEETDRIVKAQVSRGARLDQGGFLQRMMAFFPVLIPLFVIIFRRAEELALAMEARGYRGGTGRTRRTPLVWKKSDTGATIFTMLTIFGFMLLRTFVLRRIFP